MKGDYTRTGKRKAKGVVKDGVNSVSRFVINRFKDSMRQIAMDIFCGKFIVGVSDESILFPLKEQSIPLEHLNAMEHCSTMIHNEFEGNK